MTLNQPRYSNGFGTVIMTGKGNPKVWKNKPTATRFPHRIRYPEHREPRINSGRIYLGRGCCYAYYNLFTYSPSYQANKAPRLELYDIGDQWRYGPHIAVPSHIHGITGPTQPYHHHAYSHSHIYLHHHLPYRHPHSLSPPLLHKPLTIPIREHPMCLNLTPIRTFPCPTTMEIMKLQFRTLTIVNYLFLTIPILGIRHALHLSPFSHTLCPGLRVFLSLFMSPHDSLSIKCTACTYIGFLRIISV